MRGRTILILVAVLVALAAIATVVENGRNRKTRPSGAQLIPGMNIDWSTVSSSIPRGRTFCWRRRTTDGLRRAREDSRPSASLSSDILEALRKGTADEVISTNPANQSLFMVDTGGIELRVGQQGKEIAHLYHREAGPGFSQHLCP